MYKKEIEAYIEAHKEVRIQNKVYVAGQTIQYIVVALAEADIFFQRQHSHAAVAEIRLCQLPAAARARSGAGV